MTPGSGGIRLVKIVEREGQTLAEYAMILLFVAVACVAAVSLLGVRIQGFYNGLNGSF
jgi:Flp pilus assembly pilin Flp